MKIQESLLYKQGKYTAIDVFAGCGGLSCGLEQAGFSVVASIEIDELAARTYKLNHPSTTVIQKDIREIDIRKLIEDLKLQDVDLLAGCPPCQGFSSMRRRNKKRTTRDTRNSLILEYLRVVEVIMPKTILLENVPALQQYYLFDEFIAKLKSLGYQIKFDVLNAANYSVPQRRKRLVLLGSRIGEPFIPVECEDTLSVADAIGHLPNPDESGDPLQKIHSSHTERIADMIALVPKNGGSRSDLPEEYKLKCHKKENIGFSDVYGRMSWDSVSPTITGGCLNPSKGRFLHPTQNRSISVREASLLQTFPETYIFPENAPRQALALLIGNALPPEFARRQALSLKWLLDRDASKAE